MRGPVAVLVLSACATFAGCAAPIWQAVYRGEAATVERLLADGADPNYESAGGNGTTILHVAAALGHLQIVELLLAKGAAIDPTLDRGNQTPLHFAAEYGRVEVIRVLLEHGADPLRLAREKTPRSFAQEKGFHEAAALLAEVEGGRRLASAPPQSPGSASLSEAARLPPLKGSALVMELKAVGSVPAHVPSVVTRLLLARLDDVEGLRTVSPEDLQLMLSVEKQKDALGCDDVKCIAELGGALGTDFVIYGQIAMMGSQYNLTLTAIDAKHSVAVARVSNLVAATEDALARNVPAAVAALLAKMARPVAGAP